MSGKTGFTHKCGNEKTEIGQYHLSLKESGFTDEQIKVLWDFYVSRSFAAATENPISLESCGWQTTTNKNDGYPALEREIAIDARISDFCIIRNKTIKDTLKEMDLFSQRICTSHPRAVMNQKYHIQSDENEKVTIVPDESRIASVFRHIRNSFAHGNTYFFPDGNCLLLDKDGNTPTAAILIPKQSLWNWISIVDKNKFYYDVEAMKRLRD